jgi:predicted PurR-regulated permease PerM
VVAVYALMDKQRLLGQSKKLLFAFFSPKRANDILQTARHGHMVFGKFLSGKIITSLMIGFACFILMSIFRIPYPLLVSVIIAFTNVIPFFGPFIGGVPSALIILLTDLNKGIIFCVIIVVLQQIEGNILTPRVLGSRIGISEFWVTSSLLLFGGMFGFVGMIVAVPLFALLYYIAKMIVNRRLEEKELPLPSEEYQRVESLEEDGFVFFSEDKKGRDNKSEPSLGRILGSKKPTETASDSKDQE